MGASETLIIAAHGSLADGRAAAPAYAHAARLRARGGFDAVRVAFWKQEPGLRTIARSLERGSATVVPLLSSAGYFADEVFPAELGLVSDDASQATMRYADPVGTHPAVADVIADRVAAAIDALASTTVIVVGHGTDRNPQSAASTQRHAERLRQRGRYAAVRSGFLDDEPNVTEVLGTVRTTDVVVVPLFMADGPHTAEDVPAALGHPGIGRTAILDGHTVHYTGAVGTAPSLVDVIQERAVEAGATVGRDGDPGGLVGAERRLADRFEAGDGPRTWGELQVCRSSEGFALLHAADANRSRAELATIERLAALRRRTRHDAQGRYRPLSGERNLPQGWITPGLSAIELGRALETVYPGAVIAWDRDLRGTLDPTPIAETIDRQRGMYADIERLSESDCRAVAAAVCGSCVRERRWPVGRETMSDSEEPIPCEGACPFLLAAAHGLSEHGPAAAKTADTDTHAASFDDPANRFRVRYARARHATETAAPVQGGDR